MHVSRHFPTGIDVPRYNRFVQFSVIQPQVRHHVVNLGQILLFATFERNSAFCDISEISVVVLELGNECVSGYRKPRILRKVIKRIDNVLDIITFGVYMVIDDEKVNRLAYQMKRRHHYTVGITIALFPALYIVMELPKIVNHAKFIGNIHILGLVIRYIDYLTVSHLLDEH